MVFVMALPVTIFYERNGWPIMGVGACKCARGAYSIKLHCSALLLACFSGDQHAAIVKAKGSSSMESFMPLDGDRDKDKAQPIDTSILQGRAGSSMPQGRDISMAQLRERSWAYRLLVSLAIWALAVVLSVPTFIYTTLHQSSVDRSYYSVDHDLNQSYVDDDLNQSYVDDDLDQSIAEHDDLTVSAECAFNLIVGDFTSMVILVPVQISLGFFLPLLVAGFSCVRVTVTLLRTKTFCQHEATCMVLTVVFAMCHLPYNAVLLYHVTNWKMQMSCKVVVTLLTVTEVTRSVAYVHGCLYPFLYALTIWVFRRRVQRRANTDWRST
ncbi:C-C chemokine receptor type 6-like [Engraulis encrasicolus]|uniref:C-C chemokine receptor type 6-like n=1 Tax=Engraulis encrasicolus TaxID=184585 RepID=UPI002FD06ECA